MSLSERFWLRVNNMMGADLPKGVDLGLGLTSLLVGDIIGRIGLANTPTSMITIIGAMPLVATYYVRSHRENFNTQGGRGFLLYLRALFWFLVAFVVLGGVGCLFARFGGPGS
ncbi:MAG: hypothetical protein AB7S92_11315 [Parvibaculaceae bacterium]